MKQTWQRRRAAPTGVSKAKQDSLPFKRNESYRTGEGQSSKKSETLKEPEEENHLWPSQAGKGQGHCLPQSHLMYIRDPGGFHTPSSRDGA